MSIKQIEMEIIRLYAKFRANPDSLEGVSCLKRIVELGNLRNERKNQKIA